MKSFESRYTDIINDLGIDLDLTEVFEKIKSSIAHNAGRDYVASRGEYLNAHVYDLFLIYKMSKFAMFLIC